MLSAAAATAVTPVTAARTMNQKPSSGNLLPVGAVTAPVPTSEYRMPYPRKNEPHRPWSSVAEASRAL